MKIKAIKPVPKKKTKVPVEKKKHKESSSSDRLMTDSEVES
jgi:hypothetical protein